MKWWPGIFTKCTEKLAGSKVHICASKNMQKHPPILQEKPIHYYNLREDEKVVGDITQGMRDNTYSLSRHFLLELT